MAALAAEASDPKVLMIFPPIRCKTQAAKLFQVKARLPYCNDFTDIDPYCCHGYSCSKVESKFVILLYFFQISRSIPAAAAQAAQSLYAASLACEVEFKSRDICKSF